MRSNTTALLVAPTLLALTFAGCGDREPASSPSVTTLDRTVLPVHLPPRQVCTVLDVRNATPPPNIQVTAPAGAPNVVVVLLDDLGFAGTSAFGGPVATPTFDRIAAEGVRFNNFHTTAVCSPTRSCLKTGRNHQVNNMACIIEMGTAFPGNTGQIPDDVAPLAEMLRLNGYSTAHFGKNHETAAWEASMAGPFDRWPTRQGFDKFYGFMGGETNQWAPFIYDGTHAVELPNDPKYHFMTDMTDQAIAWTLHQKALAPDKPFYTYFAPGAVHAPHHAPLEWSARWKGKFDKGWDVMRQEILERQIALGVVPKGTVLAPKPEAIPAWDSLSADEKRLFTRQAEVFAGFLEYTDHEVGRLVDAIERTGQLDNTMLVFIYGDNGSSAEGGRNGMFSEMTFFNGVQETVPDMLKHLDDWGGPTTYPHMAAGWAVAFDTPFQWTKQVASDPGGTKVGMAVRWPKGIKAKGEVRTQFAHVVDIPVTILAAANLPEPKSVNGIPQRPMDGTSLIYAFNDGAAAERHTTQYFEMFGNRAIYHEGWYARVIHRAPWERTVRRPLAEDIWELYDTRTDFSLTRDLAAQQPERLARLKTLFTSEAERNFVMPIDDRLFERMIAANVGRPDPMAGRTSLSLAQGMTGMTENVFLNIKNQSKIISAELEIPEGVTANGAIIVQGGRFGGWALYAKDGKLAYDYNFLGMERTTIEAAEPLKPGKHSVRFEFAYEGGGIGKGGLGTIFIDDVKAGEGRIGRTQSGIFSADETADVGIDLATPVVERIGAEAASRFNGRIPAVTVSVK